MVSAALLVHLGPRLGLTRPIERLYAAAVTTGVGAWPAVATANGQGHRPLPQFLLFGGTLLSVPWWAHRRRRARVRVERTLAAWPQVADASASTALM